MDSGETMDYIQTLHIIAFSFTWLKVFHDYQVLYMIIIQPMIKMSPGVTPFV